MEQRLQFVTLGVRDLAESRRFYVDGLGWTPVFEVPGVVVFFQVGPGLLLSLFGARDLEVDVSGEGASLPASSAPAFSLSQNYDSEQAVDAGVQRAVDAGAVVLKPAQHADFGGYHGYVADPDGVRWELAYNPGHKVAPDGTVSIGPIG